MLKFDEQMEIDHREGDLNRARSVTVGTCFGGTTEIMMRGNKNYMWTPMQPVEVIELIHQLAANVGCQVALKPRQDFASWRNWRVTEEEKKHLNGHPPFVNDMAPFQQLGATGVDPELLAVLDNGGKAIEFGGGQPFEGSPDHIIDFTKEGIQNVMATEKPKNRRSSKRTAKAT